MTTFDGICRCGALTSRGVHSFGDPKCAAYRRPEPRPPTPPKGYRVFSKIPGAEGTGLVRHKRLGYVFGPGDPETFGTREDAEKALREWAQVHRFKNTYAADVVEVS